MCFASSLCTANFVFHCSFLWAWFYRKLWSSIHLKWCNHISPLRIVLLLYTGFTSNGLNNVIMCIFVCYRHFFVLIHWDSFLNMSQICSWLDDYNAYCLFSLQLPANELNAYSSIQTLLKIHSSCRGLLWRLWISQRFLVLSVLCLLLPVGGRFSPFFVLNWTKGNCQAFWTPYTGGCLFKWPYLKTL